MQRYDRIASKIAALIAVNSVPHVDKARCDRPPGGCGFVGGMSRRGWLLFALMCLLWGLPYLMIKVAVAEVSPPVVVLARTGIGAVLLLPFAIRSSMLVTLKRRWPRLVTD